MELARRAGVLLGPQCFQQLGDPAADRTQAVQARMTRPAEGDQSGRGVRRPAVVDDQRVGGAADAAGAAVTGEDFFPAAGEAGARAAAAVVAAETEPAAEEGGLAAGAAERDLLVRIEGHGGRLFSL